VGVIIRALVISLIFVLAADQTASSAETCNTDGYSETVLKAAQVEFGEFSSFVYLPNMSNEIVSVPAIYDILSRVEYDNLPADLTYITYSCEEAVIGTRPANISPGRISDYDMIIRADESEYMRPLEPSIQSINAALKEEFVVSEAKFGFVEKTMVYPEPVVLPDGRVRVLKRPSESFARCNIGITKTLTSKYIKSRTPAIIRLTPCNKEKL